MTRSDSPASEAEMEGISRGSQGAGRSGRRFFPRSTSSRGDSSRNDPNDRTRSARPSIPRVFSGPDTAVNTRTTCFTRGSGTGAGKIRRQIPRSRSSSFLCESLSGMALASLLGFVWSVTVAAYLKTGTGSEPVYARRLGNT